MSKYNELRRKDIAKFAWIGIAMCMSFSTSRIAAGYSLDDISREFRVPSERVMDWENGSALPPQHIARSLDLIHSFGAETVLETEHEKPPSKPLTTLVPARARAAVKMKNDRLSESPNALIKSKKRVADHGEVFTPDWLVEKMLDLVKGESERIDSRFLEPACGSGNFLVPILQRKLAAVELKYGKSDFEKRHHALQALTCCYGIELLADNIAECRANMLDVFAAYLKLDEDDDLYRAAFHVLSLNLIHGDAMTMKGADGNPIIVAEWGYLGKGKFKRRDFRLDVLTGMSSFREEATLFAHLGKHEIFQPVDSHSPMTVRELSAQEDTA
jgi:DNA-binding transcriptional regulator YiaG